MSEQSERTSHTPQQNRPKEDKLKKPLHSSSILYDKVNMANVIESNIEGAFYGWSGDTVFKLTNGQLWEQDAYAYTYHYAYRPHVTITLDQGRSVMEVEGVNGAVTVRQVHDFVESQIDGELEGWNGDTVFRLVNGQVWQQSAYAYHYHYAYRPRVVVYLSKSGWKLKVDGIGTVNVTRIG